MRRDIIDIEYISFDRRFEVSGFRGLRVGFAKMIYSTFYYILILYYFDIISVVMLEYIYIISVVVLYYIHTIFVVVILIL